MRSIAATCLALAIFTTAEASPLAQPPAKTLTISPAPLTGDKQIVALPSAVSDVCVGGGGRFLILHLPQERKLAVFDVNEAKLVKYLPAADDSVRFAASMEKLVMVFPDRKIFQRWSLLSFEKEITAPLPLATKPHVVVMGSATDGPLVCGMSLGLSFIDIQSVRELTPEKEAQGRGLNFDPGWHPMVLRISSDGRVLGAWHTDLSPQGLNTLVLTGKQFKAYNEHTSVGHIAPGPDGRAVFTAGGVYSPEARKIGEQRGYTVPAAHGNSYLAIHRQENAGQNRARATVHLLGDNRPLVTLNNLEGLEGFEPWNRNGLAGDKSIHMIPLAKVIAIIPKSADKLILHRFDLDEALEKSDIDYLLVTSQPVSQAIKGQPYRYDMSIKSKKGGVKCSLDAGPDGMKATPDGKISWTVPKDFAEADTVVILTVSDATGQEIFHTFKIGVRDKAEAVATSSPPPDKTAPEVAFKTKDPLKVPEPKGLPSTPKSVAVPINPPPAATESKFGIVPAPLKQDREERAFPSAVESIRVGGGGRYLILHLPKDRQLAIFDVNQAKVVKYLPTAEGAKFAAGLEHLFVSVPTGNLLQRVSLKTFEREKMAVSPLSEPIEFMAMGSASNGPLVVGGFADAELRKGGSGLRLLDPQTFKETEQKFGGAPGFVSFTRPTGPMMSAGGEILVYGGRTWLKDGANYNASDGRQMGLIPGPDGRTMFPTGYHSQLFTPTGSPIGKAVGGHGNGVWYIPATQGSYFVALNQVLGSRFGVSSFRPTVHIVGDQRPLVTLDKIDAVEGLIDWISGQWQPFYQHVFFVPDAQLLAVLPQTKDRLVLYRVDLAQLLAKADVDYFFVESQPTLVATKGKTYSYQLAVRSKRGGVQVALDTAPKGMTVTPDGKLIWNVPADLAAASQEVLLTLSDASGQEVFHSFRISVRDEPPNPKQ